MKYDRFLYPFSAIVGQEKMKRSLLVNAVDFRIGGLLIKGERGTAKSSAARSLAELLPEMDAVMDCPFSCNPHNNEEMCDCCLATWEDAQPLPLTTRPASFITPPLNATEDRVVGTLDLERALKEGTKDFEPGLLAAANRSILYVDEVNLLDDHIVDILLDAAAMGVNIVEREAVSYSHPASFLLIGTMNPEEGDLRPQLEDRFGLCIEVKGESDAASRIEIMRRRNAFLADPEVFRAEFEPQQREVREKIVSARKLLPQVEIDDAVLELVSNIAVELGVCGHRADIATCRAAMALAAFEGSLNVTQEYALEAAEMAFPHRLGKTPFDHPKGMECLREVIEKKGKLINLPGSEGSHALIPLASRSLPLEIKPSERTEKKFLRMKPTSGPEDTPILEGQVVKSLKSASGKRNTAVADSQDGRRVGHTIPEANQTLKAGNVAIDATLRAAAARSASQQKPFEIAREDLRKAVRRRKVGNLILFVLDASASMGSREKIESTRKVVSDLLVDAYQKRDKVGLISFRDDGAQLVLTPTSSAQIAKIRLKELATGGATPLSHGLALALEVAKRELKRNTGISPLLVLITDGYGNVAYTEKDPVKESLLLAGKIRDEKIASVVFDTSASFLLKRTGTVITHARRIADAMGARYYPLGNTMEPKEMLDRLGKSLGT